MYLQLVLAARNVLAVGKTGCGKTYFLQKLGLNKFFGNFGKTKWISGIDIDEEGEAEMRSFFTNNVELPSTKERNELIDLIEKSEFIILTMKNNGLREKITMDCLIVMDNFLGIANNCKAFVGFLPVSRKYRYRCIYVFHIIGPESQIWRKILSNILS